jgi:hypothetical protein
MPYFGVFIENGKAPGGGPAIYCTEIPHATQELAVAEINRILYPPADVYVVEADSYEAVFSVFTETNISTLHHVKLLRRQSND